MRTLIRLLGTTLVLLFVAACTDNDAPVVNLDPVAFHSGDECHICGMLITEWPGPKAESINRQSGETLKFCSTTDLFSWWLQPENRTLQAQIYVHDMAQTHWDQPEDEHLIDGRLAWYVLGSDRMGAMGPTLASFAREDDARTLAEQHGGRLLRFDDISLEVLQEIGKAGHEHAANHGRMLREAMGADEEDDEQPLPAH